MGHGDVSTVTIFDMIFGCVCKLGMPPTGYLNGEKPWQTVNH